MSTLKSRFGTLASPAAASVSVCDRPALGIARHALGCVMLACAAPLFAQVATGDILGNITDSSGSVIPGASIRIENTGTHEVRTFTTKADGAYVFSALQPGTYSLNVTAPSFKSFTTADIVVSASDRVRIDSRLQPGSVSDTVQVNATPTSLQTDSTTVGSTITEKTLVDAPLNGRNYIGLVTLQAGVNGGSQTSLLNGSNQTDRRLSSSVSANGQQEIFNNNLVDGLDNNDRFFGAPILRPSVEAIAEVRTDINLYSAEVGRTGGAAINVITKSGANQVHGSAYEFFRNDITDARNFFATTSILSRKPELRQNQFGGSLSGPIFRDRTFFFVDYEGLRRIDGNNSVFVTTVPTAAEQANPGYLGDIVNPVLSKPGQAPVYVASLPAAALDPTALAYFKLFPLPNQGGPAATANNFLFNPTASLYSNIGDVRIDHHFSASDTLFGRYSYNRTNAFSPPSFPNVNGVAAGGALTNNGYNNIIAHNGQLGYTHIFTPSLLMELKAGYTLFNLNTSTLNNGQNYNDQAPYLIPNANECAQCSGLATIYPVGYGSLGDAVVEPALAVEHNSQFAGTVTYVHGRQTFKMGASFIRRNVTNVSPIYPKGLYLFPTVAVPAAGVYAPSLQNFLTGAPYQVLRQAFIGKPYDRTMEPSAYFQDDWRATDRLTFNIGLRYDLFTKFNDKNNNFANFDIGSLTLIDNATGNVQNAYKDFSPRLGFDATIAPGTVLRGGFGLTFFVSDSTNTSVLNDPPLGFNSSNIDRVPHSLSTIGAPAVVVQSTATANLSGALIARGLHEPDGYLEQFNLLLQKEYRGTVFTAGYVGELGRHIFDQVPNIELPTPAPGATPPALIYAKQLPNVTSIDYVGNFGASSYNSFQTSLERRVTHGLTANINYTYSHNLDDVFQIFDGDGSVTTAGFGLLPSKISTYDYGNSPIDLKSRIAGFFSYDIPTGKSGSHLYREVAGGFRFNGVGFWQTGTPFTVTSAATQGANALATINLPLVTSDKPNVIGSTHGSHSLTQFFNVAAFAQQAVGTAGNEERNNVFGPNLRRGDLSLFKTIPIREALTLELRAECFNITNTPNFAQPNHTIAAYGAAPSPGAAGALPLTTGGFGSITSTVFNFSGRQFQFAGRLSF